MIGKNLRAFAKDWKTGQSLCAESGCVQLVHGRGKLPASGRAAQLPRAFVVFRRAKMPHFHFSIKAPPIRRP
jgi:hypothetical protein